MSYLAATGDLLAVARAALRERLVPSLDGEAATTRRWSATPWR